MPTLRQQCKQRFKVAFDSVRVISGSMTFILVVDEKSLKILSNTIKMMELINYGITAIEKLQLKRKKFKKIQAVYLIHPDSYKGLLQDFQQGQEPQYHSIHVICLTKIPAYAMKEFSQNTQFLKRVKTLKQLNLNFSLFSHNQVKLLPAMTNSFGAPLLTQQQDQYQECVAFTVEELTTVLTALSTFYIVEIYYNKSALNNFAEKVALGLKDNLQNLFKLYEKNNIPNYDSGAPQTTFLILDRTFDPVTPLLRDYHYGPMLYDFKNLQSHKCTVTKNKQSKVFSLDQNDQIMQKYQNQHFATTLTGLQKDFETFSQTHSTAKFQKTDKQNLTMTEMSQMIKTMPKYNEFKEKYGFHIEMLSDIYQNYEKSNLKEQGELQQTIVIGTNDQGKKPKENQISDAVISMTSKSKSEQKAKLLMLALMCLELKTKQRSAIIEKLNDLKNYAACQNTLQYLVGNGSFKLNQKKTKNNLILDRFTTKLEQIVKNISEGGQANLKFFRIGRGNATSKPVKNTGLGNLGRKKIGIEGKQQNQTKPRLIVVISSGISYNEIRALSEFESTYQIIYVSHNFLTPTQYLRKLALMLDSDEL